MLKWEFQLTRSRGAWLFISVTEKRPCKFQLTRSRGAWHSCKDTLCTFFKFQLTRSRGAWRRVLNNFIIKSYISTHTLTWSVTSKLIIINIYKIFQLTRSRGAWLGHFTSYLLHCYFNSHAHVERDTSITTGKTTFDISTHTLTWSVTLFRHSVFKKW